MPGTENLYEVELAATGASAPTASTVGLSMAGRKYVRVTLSAESGRTLSGTGSLACYVYDGRIGAWIPSPDDDITITFSGARRVMFGEKQFGVPMGAIYYLPVTVGISGGTNVTVTLNGH